MRSTLFKTLGIGIILYSCMYLAWSLLAAYGFAGTFTARVILLLVLLCSTLIAARSLRLHAWRDMLPFSVSWVVVIGAIDALFAAPSESWVMFADPNLWIGYCLVLFAPLVVPLHPPHLEPHATIS